MNTSHYPLTPSIIMLHGSPCILLFKLNLILFPNETIFSMPLGLNSLSKIIAQVVHFCNFWWKDSLPSCVYALMHD